MIKSIFDYQKNVWSLKRLLVIKRPLLALCSHLLNNINYLLCHGQVRTMTCSQLLSLNISTLRSNHFHHRLLILEWYRHILTCVNVRHGYFPPCTLFYLIIHGLPIPTKQWRDISISFNIISTRTDQYRLRISAKATIIFREVESKRHEMFVSEFFDLSNHRAAFGESKGTYVDEVTDTTGFALAIVHA